MKIFRNIFVIALFIYISIVQCNAEHNLLDVQESSFNPDEEKLNFNDKNLVKRQIVSNVSDSAILNDTTTTTTPGSIPVSTGDVTKHSNVLNETKNITTPTDKISLSADTNTIKNDTDSEQNPGRQIIKNDTNADGITSEKVIGNISNNKSESDIFKNVTAVNLNNNTIYSTISSLQNNTINDNPVNTTVTRSTDATTKTVTVSIPQTVIADNSTTVNETTPATETNVTSKEEITPGEPVLPEKGSAEQERNSSISIFFVLCVLALGILLIHLMLLTNFQYLPESIAIVFLGAIIGLILNLMSDKNIANWRKEEAFSPTAFFLVLLPPIIFESGYNLHKGNFFQNIGSILVFAIFGTLISALVIGAGVYILGLADITYQLSFVESFAFGSLISAVDPVATVAIFHALDVDPVLNMLVFGESILNDAVAIVLTTSILSSDNPAMSTSEAVLTGITQFCLMFFASAGIGVIFALISALLLKYVDLRKNPSLEFGMMLVFTYAPYALAEGIHLSGIMAILFNGIVMSHYTHFNLSTVTQITMQQTMRTLAFIAETCVFAYLGLALFSFRHRFEPALVFWSLILCLFGRACNIYPLAILCNKFREHQITNRMMFIMWFSGLRGAISYALSLHLEFSDETRHVIITTTLIIVLVTTLIFGGSTMPLMQILQGASRSAFAKKAGRKKKKEKALSLSKTKEWGQAIDSEHLSELTEEELEVNFNHSRISGFAKLDIKYLIPFLTRRFTQQELKDCKTQMTDLTNQWYQAIRISPIESEEEKSRSPS